jgi:glutathione S-transferase
MLNNNKSFRLWHSPGARSSRVLWTIHELGLENQVDLITMPFPPRIFYKPYLQHNILGTIPFFQSLIVNEEHIQMTESVAICLYLAQKYNSKLVVTPGEKDYSSFLNWMYHSDATLTFPQTVVLRYTVQEVGVADEAAMGYAKWYIARLRLLNQTLSDGREYLCMNRFTVADICIVYALFIGTSLREPKSGKLLSDFYKSHTKKWMNNLLKRKGWINASIMENASLKKFQQQMRRDKGGKL